MIPINYSLGFFIFFIAWFVYLTILWARESWRTSIKEWSLSGGKLHVCDECSHPFIVKPRESRVRCPKCNNLCHIKKGKHKKII